MSEKRGTKFIVLTSQRSGSTWMINLLNQVENTTAYGELFLGRRRVLGRQPWESPDAYPRFSESKVGRLSPRPISVISYLNNLFRKPGAVGFKLMYTQLYRYPELLAYLVLHRVKVIHLVRENTLDVMISRAISRATDTPHRISEAEWQDNLTVELNPKTLVKRMRTRRKKIARARRILDLTGLAHIEVTYEQMLSDPDTFLRVCDFLGIETGNERPESKLVKIRKRGQSEIIRNYDQVKELLAGTPFEHLLEDENSQAQAEEPADENFTGIQTR